MKHKYELSLTSSYVANWGLQDALRELIQNGIDQKLSNPDNKFSVDYDAENKVLKLSNSNSVLSRRSLLLGYTTKSDDSQSIGQFGEGYKIALLVLTRLNRPVTIYNYGKKEVWTPKFVRSRKYEGENVLNIIVDTDFSWKSVPKNDLVVRIDGISKEDYTELVDRTLMLQDMSNCRTYETSRGTILLDKKYSGEIYVDGLFVTDIPNCRYGYSIKPSYLPIGRDRNIVSGFDVQWETSNMWSEVADTSELLELVKSDSFDVQYITRSSSALSSPLISVASEMIYDDFIKENGTNSIPVCDQSQLSAFKSALESASPVLVNELYHSLISMSSRYGSTMVLPNISSPKELYESWKSRYYNQILTEEAIQQLDSILNSFQSEESLSF